MIYRREREKVQEMREGDERFGERKHGESREKERGRVRNSDRGQKGDEDTFDGSNDDDKDRRTATQISSSSFLSVNFLFLSLYNWLCVEGGRNRVGFPRRLRKRRVKTFTDVDLPHIAER